MLRDDLRHRVRMTIADALGIDLSRLADPATTDTVDQWDSLGHFQIIELLSDRFAITMDHDEAVRLVTEDAIVSALEHRGQR